MFCLLRAVRWRQRRPTTFFERCQSHLPALHRRLYVTERTRADRPSALRSEGTGSLMTRDGGVTVIQSTGGESAGVGDGAYGNPGS